jgi:SAM-dependent methyltransferase
MPPAPPRLVRSAHLSWFGHMGAVYLYHDLYGFLLEMSPDIAELVDAFEGGAETSAVVERFAGRFGDADPRQFVDVLASHFVLIEPGEDELEGLWPMVAIKGKWNVWQRRGNAVTIWTAWGERPIAQLLLDEEETQMWDAFDGEKRLIELRGRFDRQKLMNLVVRLTHSDVQALKLCQLPMSTFARRPQMAPRYLASTMPYRSWKPGEPVPGTLESNVSPTAYYEGEVADADQQFDHRETTLSHLFRIPHPALAGRTYGESLIDGLVQRGHLPVAPSAGGPARRLDVLEIGAGLGYVARDVMSRLKGFGFEINYTIVELAPALAQAQRKLLGEGAARWIEADVLAVELPAASFDFILSNEMIGDLPARYLSRTDIGLPIGENGQADLELVRQLGKGGQLAADLGVNLDDAPEPLFLMTGAFELVERVSQWLRPGGLAVLTEFGEHAMWPRLSTHLDHPELSTHFGQLVQAARGLGMNAGIEFIIDIIDLDRDAKGLATTRSHFRALRALFEAAGADLPKIGMVDSLLKQAAGDKVDLDKIGELRWDRIEDRLMGLVPHEFKMIAISKPA